MVFKNIKQFPLGEVVVIFISILAHPLGYLGVPCECVAADCLRSSVGSIHYSVRSSEIEIVSARFGCVEFHFVFADKHVEFTADDAGRTFRTAAIVAVCRNGHTYMLAQLACIFAERGIVGQIRAPVIVGILGLTAFMFVVIDNVTLSGIFQ